MRTKAEPQDNGTYKLTGQKIFISAGDHDMADNIIHLVLAKIPGGPEGVKPPSTTSFLGASSSSENLLHNVSLVT